MKKLSLLTILFLMTLSIFSELTFALSPEERDQREKILVKYPEIKKLALIREKVSRTYSGIDEYIDAILMAVLTQEHLYAFGPAGGCKTSAGMKCIEQFDGRTTAIQFTRATRVEEVRGAPITDDFLKYGKINYNTSDALVMYDYLVLDEADKCSTDTLEALLSSLNERALFLGKEKSIKGNLKTALITSNSSIYAVLQRFSNEGKLETGEAFFNRILFKTFVANKSIDAKAIFQLLALEIDENEEQGDDSKSEKVKMLQIIGAMKREIGIKEFSEDIKTMMANVINSFDDNTQLKATEEMNIAKSSPEDMPFPYYPTTMISHRDVRKAIKVIQAGIVLSFVKEERSSLKPAVEDVKYLKYMLTTHGDPRKLIALKPKYSSNPSIQKTIDDIVFENRSFDDVYNKAYEAHQETLKRIYSEITF